MKTLPDSLDKTQLRRWFADQGWKPFPFQEEVWRAWQASESGLIHSPTGTGKTYAVWFAYLLQAFSGEVSDVGRRGPLRLLWVTPLRALAVDICLSLERPLKALGLPFEVEFRTSDTATSIKKRQSRSLPHVLITTPESLSLLLSYPGSSKQFEGLKGVIVDEWHELISTKRGVQTELALARLRRWCPALRIWGLSATLGNLETALAALLGSRAREGRLVDGRTEQATEIECLIPTRVETFPRGGHMGTRMLAPVIRRIEEGGSTLLFTNTRSQTETWYQAILQRRPDWAGLLAIHHGSIERKTRVWVEDGLRNGRLKCVVCTSSLDLGVDFSPVDQVIQVGSSRGVGRFLQRAGRSGHQPGRASRIICVPTNALELIEVAALRDAVAAGRIEERRPLERPLDLLIQHLVTVAAGGGFDSEALLAEIRETHAYRNLQDAEWHWAVDFISRGGQALQAYPDYRRVRAEEHRYVAADAKLVRRHRMSIGTITSDASLEVRFSNGRRVGQVEESFLAKLKPGDRFVLAGSILELLRIRDSVAWVRRAPDSRGLIPRWMGGRMPLSSCLADSVRSRLGEAASGRLRGREMKSAGPVLELQRRWSMIPSPGILLVERLRTREGHHLFFYPFEGRLVHEGLAALTAWRLGQAEPRSFSISCNDYGFELLSPEPFRLPQNWDRSLFAETALAADIESSLNATEMGRQQFREISRVAGLIFEGYPGSRKRDRQIQVSSGLLYDVLSRYDPDNLLLDQARREVLESRLEVSRLKTALDRISHMEIVLKEIKRPTPLAFPLIVSRLRQRLSSEKLEDRVQRMIVQLEKAADRNAELSPQD